MIGEGVIKENSLQPHSKFMTVVTAMISSGNKRGGCYCGGGRGNASGIRGQSLDRRGMYAHIHCS